MYPLDWLFIILNQSSRTRPDRNYSINTLSRFQVNPRCKQFEILLKLLGYVLKTKEWKLNISNIRNLTVTCFSDADYAADRSYYTLLSSQILLLCNSLISWGTRKQKATAFSTIESESITLAEATKELIWIINILKECKNRKLFNLNIKHTTLYCDNQSAIKFSKSIIKNSRSKRIDVKYHFIHKLGHSKEFDLKFAKTRKMNTADMFTKLSTKETLKNFFQELFYYFFSMRTGFRSIH